ncbi:hypothetical protein ABT324_08040 [Saccharopolyspora sp. NPDC000359]
MPRPGPPSLPKGDVRIALSLADAVDDEVFAPLRECCPANS